ncbi:MAG TPA: hypothetical protein DCE26_06570 [Dehalococcoidia bacterium]|nr:hypothetical protein [SAR202 cluster bacterium]HAA95336.1 hypothetical protein [Dehalococcoidia bacterium]
MRMDGPARRGMQNHTNNEETEMPEPGEVVCFGVLSYLQLMVVDEPPVYNGGTPVRTMSDSYGDDAAIVADMLYQLGQPARFLPSALGDDDLGRKVAATVGELGVPVQPVFKPGLSTVAEISISDATGGRTYLYHRTPELLATLDETDISPLETAAGLYVDWYDENYILRPMKRATELGIPVLVNIESQYENRELLAQLAPYSAICQVSIDGGAQAIGVASESHVNLTAVAHGLVEAGFHIAAVTRGDQGSVVADSRQTIRTRAPRVEVIDGNGAGSSFSAAMLYGQVRRWPLEQCARFATAQGSLKCTTPGYKVPAAAEGLRLASTLDVEVTTR